MKKTLLIFVGVLLFFAGWFSRPSVEESSDDKKTDSTTATEVVTKFKAVSGIGFATDAECLGFPYPVNPGTFAYFEILGKISSQTEVFLARDIGTNAIYAVDLSPHDRNEGLVNLAPQDLVSTECIDGDVRRTRFVRQKTAKPEWEEMKRKIESGEAKINTDSGRNLHHR